MVISRKFKRGFTLVELMIVVAIIGVLAALAIFGVRKYVSNAKTAEARTALGRMGKDASTAYDKEGLAGTVLALGSVADRSNQLCPDAAAKVPSAATSIQGKKYQSIPSEWMVAGWECVKFSMKDPQYYMYNYDATGSDTVGSSFTGTAEGDLNGDGQTSTFSIVGEIKQGTTGGMELIIAPNIVETNPTE